MHRDGLTEQELGDLLSVVGRRTPDRRDLQAASRRSGRGKPRPYLFGAGR
jgi:hypothetical protein